MAGTTRRRVLQGMALGAGAGAIASILPLTSAAQTDSDALTQRIRADLERHASFGAKFSGGPGDTATADWIGGRLRALGYDVVESTFDAPFFVERAARLDTGDLSRPVTAQAPVVATGSRGVTAPLAVIDGEVTEVGDVRGRIAVIVAPFGRHAALFPERGIGRTVIAATDAGASAVVVITTGATGEAIAMNAPEEPFVSVPMGVLAPKHADPFVAAARAGAQATLVIDGDATHRPSKNIVARLERGPQWIVMSTPRSGWYDCVSERGTGTAAFLELAEWFVGRFPELSVFLMNTGGHEYFFAGSHRVVHEAPPAANSLVWAHIGATLAARGTEERNGELVMLDTPDTGRSLMATDRARDAAIAGFRGLSGLTEPGPVRANAGELSTFTDLGHENAFAVLGLSSWFHTVLDTIDRVDEKLLVPVLRAHQRTIEIIVEGA